MIDRLEEWWAAPAPSLPLSARDVLSHAGRDITKGLPLYLAVAGWQYVTVGVPGATLVLGAGVALLTAFVAGVLGALDHQYRAAVAFGVTIAVVGQLGPYVDGLGASEGYVRTAALVVLVAAGLSAVVGYAEVRRLESPGAVE
ncbi:hypothetical protein JCM30237_15030 [Halolamina litorea]|uniref:FUSC family protein n=1 Tax=Halolamina litorea TaxID=1515593 RepID=A0ABD6BNV6_9EURY|nr:hypothetical protein [Halolamina litorea]